MSLAQCLPHSRVQEVSAEWVSKQGREEEPERWWGGRKRAAEKERGWRQGWGPSREEQRDSDISKLNVGKLTDRGALGRGRIPG